MNTRQTVARRARVGARAPPSHGSCGTRVSPGRPTRCRRGAPGLPHRTQTAPDTLRLGHSSCADATRSLCPARANNAVQRSHRPSVYFRRRRSVVNRFTHAAARFSIGARALPICWTECKMAARAACARIRSCSGSAAPVETLYEKKGLISWVNVCRTRPKRPLALCPPPAALRCRKSFLGYYAAVGRCHTCSFKTAPTHTRPGHTYVFTPPGFHEK